MVRISLAGRRVGGWVVREGRAAADGVTIAPLAKVTGWGPPPDVVDLASWAAWRWAGRRSALLTAASPAGAVRGLPASPVPSPPATVVIDAEVRALVDEALAGGGAGGVLRVPPAADAAAVAAVVVAVAGPSIVLTATHGDASAVVRRLARHGFPVAHVPREWARARAGGSTVVGARAAAFAPLERPGAVVVLDAHDESYQQEQAPTWHATDVAIERARRLGVPCVAVSACPDLSLLEQLPLLTLGRAAERSGWPVLDIFDRRDDDPRSGLYGARLVDALRRAETSVLVLNRKGRARLLACAACGELARCETCDAAVGEADGMLSCPRCGTTRAAFCVSCGATRLKTLRVGVARAREELEAILQVRVGEVTGDTDELPRTPVVIGTEAVLHRVERADLVGFLDFDQELLAPRYRAAEEALALLVRAGRLVGARRGGGRVAVQTRVPRHDVLQAALHGDPARVADAERARRALLGFPPARAIAAVSGPAAGELIERLGAQPDVELLGPSDGRWLIRAATSSALADALSQAGRPAGRLRVEVDPRRL